MASGYAKLAPLKFGFAWGLMWSLGLLFVGWMAWLWGYAMPFVQVVAGCYIGYGPSFWGAIIGALWGFIDFFIFAWLVALVYNCCCKSCDRHTSSESSV